jgi:hypothetical protein
MALDETFSLLRCSLTPVAGLRSSFRCVVVALECWNTNSRCGSVRHWHLGLGCKRFIFIKRSGRNVSGLLLTWRLVRVSSWWCGHLVCRLFRTRPIVVASGTELSSWLIVSHAPTHAATCLKLLTWFPGRWCFVLCGTTLRWLTCTRLDCAWSCLSFIIAWCFRLLGLLCFVPHELLVWVGSLVLRFLALVVVVVCCTRLNSRIFSVVCRWCCFWKSRDVIVLSPSVWRNAIVWPSLMVWLWKSHVAARTFFNLTCRKFLQICYARFKSLNWWLNLRRRPDRIPLVWSCATNTRHSNMGWAPWNAAASYFLALR